MFNKKYTIEQRSKSYIKAHKPIPLEVHQLRKELSDIDLEIKQLKNRRNLVHLKLRDLKRDKPHFTTLSISLYALELEDNCWYIGLTRDVDKRFKQHCRRKGADWTKLHKPIAIHEVRPTELTDEAEASKLEDAMTIEYAIMYGIDFVRGGGYCQTKPHWPKKVTYAAQEEYQSELASFYRRNI